MVRGRIFPKDGVIGRQLVEIRGGPRHSNASVRNGLKVPAGKRADEREPRRMAQMQSDRAKCPLDDPIGFARYSAGRIAGESAPELGTEAGLGGRWNATFVVGLHSYGVSDVLGNLSTHQSVLVAKPVTGSVR